MAADVIQINSGERVKADTDDGFLRLANTLMDALCAIELNGRQFRLVNAVMRLTYGWKGRAMMPFDRDELSRLTDMPVNEISRIKKLLIQCEILIEEGKEIGLNPFISDWSPPQKRKQKSVHSHTNNVHSHTFNHSGKCAIAHKKVCKRTQKSVHSHSKTALPSLHLKDSKDNLNTLSEHASHDSDDSNLISRPDAVIQSKNGKQWGTQIDLDSAKHVFECVSGLTMDSKEPNWAAWANDFRLMREQDKRKPEHIAQLFKFANEHHFWSTVVLSPANLRKNWGKIAAQYNADRRSCKRDTRTMEERLTDTSWATGLTEGDE